jgi:hypothetical protein
LLLVVVAVGFSDVDEDVEVGVADGVFTCRFRRVGSWDDAVADVGVGSVSVILGPEVSKDVVDLELASSISSHCGSVVRIAAGWFLVCGGTEAMTFSWDRGLKNNSFHSSSPS